MHDHDHEHEHTHDHDHEHTHDHDHEHEHHHHDHDHDHSHEAGAGTLTAVLGYMLDHNIHHAEELENIAKKLDEQGFADASRTLFECTELFGQANDKLAAALGLLKE